MWRAEKVLRSEEKKTCFFTECQTNTLDKHISLPSAKYLHLQTYFFAECICLPGVFTNGHSANVLTDSTWTNGCPRGGSLPSAKLCRVFFAFLPSAIILPSVFLKHSAKIFFAECPI